MALKANTPGCSCCGCSLTVGVNGCGGQSGALVEILSGATVVASGLTAVGTSSITFTLPAGTYTRRVSKSRFTTQTSGSFTLTCPAGLSVITTLVVDPAYVCCAACTTPTSKTLYVTTVNGTVTLTWNAGRAGWVGTKTFSGLPTVLFNVVAGSCVCSVTTGSVTLEYFVNCPSVVTGLQTISVVASDAGCPTYGGTMAYRDDASDPTCPTASCQSGGGLTKQVSATPSPCGQAFSGTFGATWTGTAGGFGTGCPSGSHTETFPEAGAFAVSE